MHETITRGTRRVILSPLGKGRWTVWVGYVGPDGAEHGSPFFKGYKSPANDYATEKAARKAAEKFFAFGR